MVIDVYEIISRKQKKQQSGLERFDHTLKNFHYRKIGEEPIETILNSKNISLYLFDFQRKYAIFVEVEKPSELNHAAFFSDYQYEHATKLFLVSLNAFHQIAQRIAHVSTQLSLVGFTARSGSTLLCKALSHAEEAFVITEPMSLIVIGQHYDMTTHSGRELVQNTLLFYSWFAAHHGATILVLKPHTMFLQILYELFPHAVSKCVFLYREPVAVVKSLLQRLPFVHRMLFQTILKRVIRNILLDIVPKDVKEHFRRNYPYHKANINELGAFIWWLFPFEEMVKILQHHAADCVVFSYEEFIATPQESLKRLWTFLGFQEASLQHALEEFAQDSQRGTVLSRSKKQTLYHFEVQRIELDVCRFLNSHYSYNLDYNLQKMANISLNHPRTGRTHAILS